MKLRTFPFSKSIGNMKPSMMIFLPLSALISFGNGSRAPLSLVWGQYRNASREKVSISGLSSTGGGLTSGAGPGGSLTSTATGFGSEGGGGGGFTSTGFGSGLGSGFASGTAGAGRTGSGFTDGTSKEVPWTRASGTGAACGD